MKRIFSYIIGLLIFSTFLCEGGGIVAWKDQSFHEDSMAQIATYSRRKLSGNEGVFNVNGKDIYLPANLYWCIDIPNSLPQELSNSVQYEMLLKQKYEMGVFRKRFPKSSAILDPWLKQLQEYQQKYDSGQYFVDWEWISKATYAKRQKSENLARTQRRAELQKKEEFAKKKFLVAPKSKLQPQTLPSNHGKEENRDETVSDAPSVIMRTNASDKESEFFTPKEKLLGSGKYREQAKANDAESQYEVGMDHVLGYNKCPSNRKTAEDWYRKAAERGYAEAQCALGLSLIANSYDAPSQEKKKQAAELFRKAAEQGHAGGEYCMGICYEFGLGIPKDREVAQKWYLQAEKQCHPLAKKALNKLKSNK